MADNVDFTPGSGATGATDDIGGVHYPRVKIALGPDGTANDAEAGAGAVDTGTMRVTLASDDPLVAAATGAGIKIHADSQLPLDAVYGPNLYYDFIDLDETKREVSAVAASIFSMAFWNYAATERVVLFYDLAAASVSVGTTTPSFKMRLPPRKASGDPSVVIRGIDRGLMFETGITIACVTTKAGAGSGNPDANDVDVNIFYREAA